MNLMFTPEYIVIIGLVALVIVLLIVWRLQANKSFYERSTLQHELQEAYEQSERLEQQLDEKAQQLSCLDEAFDTKEVELGRSETALQIKEQHLQQLQSQYGLQQQELERSRQEVQTLSQEKLTLELSLEQKEQLLKAQQAQFEQAKADLSVQFENLANRILGEKSKDFSLANEKSLQHLLQPFKEQLEGFQKRVNEVHTQSVAGQAELKTQILHVKEMGVRMSEEAQHLTQALSGNKKILGNWGEMQLEAAFERAGLQKGVNYLTQVHLKNEDGRTQLPDFVLLLPDNKQLIIDSKVSLVAYQKAVAETEVDQVNVHLKALLKDVRNHVNSLAEKDYAGLQGEQSLGFVLMFMPLEAAFLEVLRQEDGLFQEAYRKGVVIVSQTTLMPTLKMITNLWMLANSNDLAMQLGDKALDLYNQVVIVAEHLVRLGNSLNTVNKQYNQVVTSFAGNQGVNSKLEKFTALSARMPKEMPSLEEVEQVADTSKLSRIERQE